ncbi:MAG TPA: winged helix-turn-helix domain-containing protein [Candidatus Nitrosotalea sp.]|nr:winged helix-turn-helix domain-containing protein [Candidatus Nitrosotalea sp.]
MRSILARLRGRRLEKVHQNPLMGAPASVYEIGPFELNAARRTLMHSGRLVSAGPKVVETLAALAEQGGQTLSKRALTDRIWPNSFVQESNLTQNVYSLRKLFREHGIAEAIVTVAGAGYRLAVPVRAKSDAAVSLRSRRPSFAHSIAGTAAAAALALVAVAALVSGTGSKPVRPLAAEDNRLYELGRYYWNLRTAGGVRKSMEYFTLVINQEPENPLGYDGMADASATMGDYCYGSHRPSDYFARARAYLAQALALDPESIPGRATLGFILLHERRLDAALEVLHRVVGADPSYGPAREWYAIALAREGRVSEAWAEMKASSQLAPLSVSSTAWLARLAKNSRNRAEMRVYSREVRDLVSRLGSGPHPRRHPVWASIESPAVRAVDPD